MRVQLRSFRLIGSGRQVQFEPGLNIITGPITTGKTTLLRLCRVLLGSGVTVSDFPPEVRQWVRAVAGEVILGNTSYSIIRPFVSTPTARVDIAGPTEAWRLPATQPDGASQDTFGQWLLQRLGLPALRVPSAPTRVESEPTPVTINDYFLYCTLTQDEIDSSVFGHRDPFRTIKRRYVFEIIYGLYSPEMAMVQEQLREVQAELRQLQAQTKAFERFLTGTQWENRAGLERDIERARQELEAIETKAVARASAQPASPGTAHLRERLREIDVAIDTRRGDLQRERVSIEQLTRLVNQLDAQSARLTRSIVADTYLVDFEFMICPRCGTPIDVSRADAGHCGLCLQIPTGERPTRAVLIAEQDRLEAQIVETRELIVVHHDAINEIEHELVGLNEERTEVARELDFQLQSYISDSASEIAEVAAERARVSETVRRLQDYRSLYTRLDQALGDAAKLEEQKAHLEADLDRLGTRVSEAEQRIRQLEVELEAILVRFRVPQLDAPSGTPIASVDRQTYLPMLYRRRFDELSSQGLKVLVNVAHALAHHQSSLTLDLGLPQILLIDGPSSNLGHEGEDLDRINRIYDYLIELSQRQGDLFQIIVADNDVPERAKQYIRVELTENERLITPEAEHQA